MVACGGELESNRARRGSTRDQPRLSLFAVAGAGVSILLLAVAFINVVDNRVSASPEQVALLEMWQRPYTTTMLWNADSDSDDSDSSDSFSQDTDDNSQSYEKFDTSSDDSGSSDSSDTDSLRQILPSSVFKGNGEAVPSHEWDTSKLSDNDHWDSHSSDDETSGEHTSLTDQTWLGTDVKSHSWDSAQDSQLKQDLKKMYNKGINAIPKSVAKEAAADADQSFFNKWGKLGKKIAKGKTGLSSKQLKLYKEAEQSVERDEKKKEKFVNAVHKKLATASTKAAASKTGNAVKHALKIKNKIKAADRLAAKLSSSSHVKKDAPAKEPSADPGSIGDRAAVHAITQTHNAKSMVAKMSQLRQKIEADFDKVTNFAHAVKKSLPPLKGGRI